MTCRRRLDLAKVMKKQNKSSLSAVERKQALDNFDNRKVDSSRGQVKMKGMRLVELMNVAMSGECARHSEQIEVLESHVDFLEEECKRHDDMIRCLVGCFKRFNIPNSLSLDTILSGLS